MNNNKYQFKFELYQYNFVHPLHTSHGTWRVREGIIITIQNSEGKISQGEIAPIPWFGSETLSEAQEFCQQLGKTVTVEQISSIPDNLPCCQFAFESALMRLNEKLINNWDNNFASLKYSYLLPAGNKALESDFAQLSSSTFKWKIGVYPLEKEIVILQKLLKKLPPKSKLRLDANGGLNLSQAETWLAVADDSEVIEFIEQPLPPEDLSQMLVLCETYQTTLALDESVSNFKQLQDCYQKGWKGVFVIKAAITGYPSRIRDFCASKPLDVVFSSVFETKIGRQAVLKLSCELGNRVRAVGFGIDHWLEDHS